MADALSAAASWSPRRGWREGPIAFDIVDGTITALRRPGTDEAARGRGLIAVPAPANAHDHGRALSTLASGADDAPLELWLPALFLHPHVPPFLNAAVALGRMAASGIGSAVVLHGQVAPDALDETVGEVARAAALVGMRVAFGVSMRDRNRLDYGGGAALAHLPPGLAARVAERWDAPAAPVSAQVEAVRAASRHENAMFRLQYAPIGPQWCSDDLLRAIAHESAESGRRVHMHMLETARQRAWADATHPHGLAAHLDTLGLLSPRLTLAHGVWLNEADIALLAARGVSVALNTSSNLRLQSGRADAAALHRAGIALALGLDSQALDDECDIWREARLARVLNPALAPGIIDDALFATGHAVAGAPGRGRLAAGKPADIVLLDQAALMGDAIAGAANPASLLRGRATARMVRAVWVAGRCIARDGTPTGLDLAAAETELRGHIRAATRDADTAALLAAWQGALARHYGFGA